MWRWFRRLQALPELLAAYATLRADTESTMRDPQVRAALERLRADPAISPLAARFWAEWRAVECAVNALK